MCQKPHPQRWGFVYWLSEFRAGISYHDRGGIPADKRVVTPNHERIAHSTHVQRRLAMGTVCAQRKKCPERADQRVPAPSPLPAAPAHHRPEQTTLYAIIAGHFPRFVQEIERAGGHLPRFVRREFEDYLKCGLLEHGFLRVKCDGCQHEYLVAFSCCPQPETMTSPAPRVRYSRDSSRNSLPIVSHR